MHFFGMCRKSAVHSPNLTWKLKVDGFQKESPIPGCHVEVNHVKLWEGTTVDGRNPKQPPGMYETL